MSNGPGGKTPLAQCREHVFDIDNFLDAFVHVDCEGIVTAWNAQAEESFGWSGAEAVGGLASELMVPSRNRNQFQQALQLTVKQGARSRMEIAARDRRGREFNVEATFFPHSFRGRAGTGILARQLAQRGLTDAEAEKYHQALMDQLAECYSEVDLRGNIIFVNKAYCQTFGISRESREGYSYKGIYSPAHVKLFRETYSEVYRTGKPARIDYSLTLQNGKEVFNEQSVSLMRDAQGNATGFMVTVRDCFDRKQSEIELLRAKQTAETASRAKGEFVANISHEIRTPLNGVIGTLELIADTHPTPEQRELIEMARGAAHSLLAVINDVLDFSKIEAGKLELDRVEFDLAAAVRQALGTVKPSALKKGLDLQCDLGPNLPCMVLGDPVRLTQVLLNLLGNAVKFTPRGQVQLQARAESMREGRLTLKFSIADSGIGIPPEKQRAIFDAFSQADASTTRKFGGTGLGLAICSRIIQSMGGRIWVESEIGKGSIFHFTTVLEPASESGRRKEDSIHTAPPARSPELHVLLVEDNLVNQRLAVRILEKLSHKVTLAASGSEALSRLNHQIFDLVFMDVQMPEMDGFAATAAIRAGSEGAYSTIPIIAMTAHAMAGDRERCMAAGMDDYISKPVTADAIRNAIDRVMNKADVLANHSGSPD